jgi:hypothetical protein
VFKGRAQLEALLRLEDETERKLAVAALIDDIVRTLGFRAIVIGGVAVEFWTRGAYSTADIDLYLPHGPAVDERLAELGLHRDGRHWVDPEHHLFIEAPASFLAPAEEVVEVRLSRQVRRRSCFRPKTSSSIACTSSWGRDTEKSPPRQSASSRLLTSTSSVFGDAPTRSGWDPR